MEIEQLEALAFADDREAALATLIPGTEDYYFHHCLHFQHAGALERVDALLHGWVERHGRTSRVQEIERRQMLLRYAHAPRQALDHIREALDLRFDHQRQVEGEAHAYPTALAGHVPARSVWTHHAFAQASDLSGFTDRALDWLMGERLDAKRRRHLLERVRWPDYPELVSLVLADLADSRSGGFGSLPIHELLLPEQLDELGKRMPRLWEDARYVSVRLRQLRPGPDVDWRSHAGEYRAYLGRLWSLAEPLSPVFNSLKAVVLYHLLGLDRREGRYERAPFLAYLRLPRHASYAPEERLRSVDRRHLVVLGGSAFADTGLDAIGDDESLVRDYLMHFLEDADDTSEFDGLIRDDVLRFVFASAKVLSGKGDKERWYSFFDDPAQYQSIHDRVDIEFSPRNPPHVGQREPVSLEAYIKNVPTLVVKVFEIDTRNHFLAHGRDVDTSVDLDGLRATYETTHTYEEPPPRRALRTFSFPMLHKPGVYVVELVGSGKSSRALIRKGGLRSIERLSAGGHVFTILDESNRHLPDATIWLGQREYRPNASGQLVVPFSTRPGRQTILLCHGDLTTVERFDHKAETYALAADMHVERERLIAHQSAEVVIRPSLTIQGTAVPIALLEEPALVVEARDHQGVVTQTKVRVELHDDRETVHTYKVPPDLAEITFVLQGKVRSVSEQRDLELGARASYRLNQIDTTVHTDDLHLGRCQDGYVLYVLGKSGEVRPGKPVSLSLYHRDFTRKLTITLQSDEAGRIELGELTDMSRVAATTTSGSSKSWELGRDRSSYPESVHALAGEMISLPDMDRDVGNTDPRRRVSLLELRQGDAGMVYVRNASAHVHIAEGYAHLRDLAPGDYDLTLLPDGRRNRIRVTAGRMQGAWALGDHRHLEIRQRAALQIARVDVGESEIAIHVSRATRRTRVHVVGTRFVPETTLFATLGKVRSPSPGWIERFRPESHYLSGRDIGDEYRYVLERKHATRLPGNMLERPSLLLNPWSIRSTSTDVARGAEGSDYAARAARIGGPAPRSAPKPQAPPATPGSFANLDFLAHESVIALHLSPDEHGIIRLNRQIFSHVQIVGILALDAYGSAYREIALAELTHEHRDLRLQASLDTREHLGEKKAVSVLCAGSRLIIEDIMTSTLTSYDSLARVHAMFMALTRSSTLGEFDFVLGWPALDPARQRARYSEYACHELHFFLFRKDPEFFARVIQPYLASKLHKTFMDHYLIGADLGRYLSPWAYGRLNIVERILLAQRVQGERGPIRRRVRELFELLPPDAERDDRLFETALRSQSLSGEDAFGMAAMQATLKAESADIALPRARASIAPAKKAKGGPGGPPPVPAAPAAAPPPPPPAQVAAYGFAAAAPAPEPAWDSDEVADLEMAERVDDLRSREAVDRLYRVTDKTQEWAENNYYRLRMHEQVSDLVKVNAFWRDFAEHEGSGSFLSPHVAHASSSFTEMMLALAVLDLPFTPGEHRAAYAGPRMELGAASDSIVFHKEVKPVAPAEAALPVLVDQNYARLDERYAFDGNERVEKYVSGELLVHVVYVCLVVLTNPTSSQVIVDVLLQIPQGALPVNSGFKTRSMRFTLSAHATQSIEYAFYFPAAGEFEHYPVHVTKGGALVAAARPQRVTVVERLSQVDTGSWAYVSQHGTSEEVLAYLDTHNIERLDLGLMAWRMRDRSFYDQALGFLARHHVYHPVLWSYSVYHDDAPRVTEYLAHEEGFLRDLQAFFESELVTIDPVARVWYEHLEYAPLIHARAHRFGDKLKILNSALDGQYREFLRQLVYRPVLGHDERLAGTYYLLLQDRVSEALDMFDRIDGSQVTAALPYDYVRVFVALYRGHVEEARELARAHREHPVDRWRKRFEAALAVLEEGQGVRVVDEDDRDEVHAKLAAAQESFDFTVEDRMITVTYQNLAECRVSYYPMDIELLFSRQPFMQGEAHRFSIIKPQRSDVVALPAGKSEHVFSVPAEYHNANLLIEITAAGHTVSRAYYANQLLVHMADRYGQVRVYRRTDRQPLPGTYVKVYARKHTGNIDFYKDGYTDLRGFFDYASLSTDDLDHVERFAILVASDQHGALVREAAPPKR